MNGSPRTNTHLLASCVAGVMLGLASSPAVAAQPLPGDAHGSFESRSQQFIVRGAQPGTPHGPPSLSLIESNHVQMDPGVLAITCERVKSELLRELGMADHWRGRIQVIVFGQMPPTGDIIVESHWYQAGWRYRVAVPGQLQRERLVGALIRVLLLELANRENRSQRLAEFPDWLEYGLSTQLLSSYGPEIILDPRTQQSLTAASRDSFEGTRSQLADVPAVSLADFWRVSPSSLSEADREKYSRSAQVLVVELLKLGEGRVCLAEMLRIAPEFLNTQLAFQRAFERVFPTLLEAEKWWSVAWVNFLSRSQHMRRSLASTLEQLDAILQVPIQVQAATNALPGRKLLPLRELIMHTDFPRHRSQVGQAAHELRLLALNAPPGIARLVADYHRALTDYLHRQPQGGSNGDEKSANARIALRDVTQRLDALDVIRDDLARLGQSKPPLASPD